MTVVSFRQFYMAASDTDSSCKKESIFDWDLLSIGHYQYVPPPHFMYRMSAIPPSPSDSILSSAERRVRENLISINKCIRAPPKSISILYCRRLLILLILRCISGKKRRYIHYILDYEWWECEVGYPMWTLGGGLVKYRKALRESCCHLWGIEIANMTSFLKKNCWYSINFFPVLTDFLPVRVQGEPVLKFNTAVLRCQVPQSTASYTKIVSWTRGSSRIYPSSRGGKMNSRQILSLKNQNKNSSADWSV